MISLLQPRLVNGPFEDPALYVSLREQKRALLFDLGEIDKLRPIEVLKISDVFISHAHIDHFIGFDRLLRIFLGRDKKVRFYGPRGLIGQVRGKLAGYTWNLVENYRLELEVTEAWPRRLMSRRFTCRDRFRHEENLGETPFSGKILDEPLFMVSAAALDHRTPCLGFRLEEKERLSINKDKLNRLGFVPGKWLAELKKHCREGNTQALLAVPTVGGGRLTRRTEALAAEVARIVEGRKIAYVTDSAWSAANEKKIITLADGVDTLYCEAAFMDSDKIKAEATGHLTASQAGRMAGLAGVKRLEIFHLSPRYQGLEAQVRREAAECFSAAAGKPVGGKRSVGALRKMPATGAGQRRS